MKYCFALDLIDDEGLIKEYEKWHKEVWPEIIHSIKDAGIAELEIYRVYNRLFMIMKTHKSFSLEKKKKMDEKNLIVQQWETLMWKYQQSIPKATPGTKWQLMKKIFEL